jgi:hypothetical protein
MKTNEVVLKSSRALWRGAANGAFIPGMEILSNQEPLLRIADGLVRV